MGTPSPSRSTYQLEECECDYSPAEELVHCGVCGGFQNCKRPGRPALYAVDDRIASLVPGDYLPPSLDPNFGPEVTRELDLAFKVPLWLELIGSAFWALVAVLLMFAIAFAVARVTFGQWPFEELIRGWIF